MENTAADLAPSEASTAAECKTPLSLHFTVPLSSVYFYFRVFFFSVILFFWAIGQLFLVTMVAMSNWQGPNYVQHTKVSFFFLAISINFIFEKLQNHIIISHVTISPVNFVNPGSET